MSAAKKCLTCWFVFTLVLGIVMVCIGTVHRNECPAERLIPVYLIVGGIFGVIESAQLLFVAVREKQSPKALRIISSLVFWFLIIWFIAGCYWLIRIVGVSYEPRNMVDKNWCNRTVYLFTLSYQLITFMGALLACCCACVT